MEFSFFSYFYSLSLEVLYSICILLLSLLPLNFSILNILVFLSSFRITQAHYNCKSSVTIFHVFLFSIFCAIIFLQLLIEIYIEKNKLILRHLLSEIL